MSNLKNPKNPDRPLSRSKVIDWTLRGKSEFANHEIDYLSKRFPETGNCSEQAVVWAKKFGYREQMAEIVSDFGLAEEKVAFAWGVASYKDKMKKSIESPKGAYLWAQAFPEDKAEMREMIHDDELAVRWAKNIGDEDIMKSRITTKFYEKMFEKKVEGKDRFFAG